MTGPGNEIILASAGTGKTYALSNRIVRLLALGVDPTEIVALTFTRKASAEFVTAVLTKLAGAAADDARAAELADELDLGPKTARDFGEVLERVVAVMDRLQFGTFDGLFQRIAQTFPLEFGLPGGFEILDPQTIPLVQDRVLRSLFQARRDRGGARRVMLEAFRQITWGQEEKNLARVVSRFVLDCHALFLAAREESSWGSVEAVWPDGCRWLPPESVEGMLGALLPPEGFSDKRFAKALSQVAQDALTWQPTQEVNKSTVLERAISCLPDLEAGIASINYNRKDYAVTGEAALALSRIVRRYVGCEIEHAMRVARGVHRLLTNYEAAYEREVRSAGRLAFDDITALLRDPVSADWEFRLDSRFSHWLFDEFQDTSVAQWSVLRNLVEEVLQDDSRRRSVFFVGDAKQAIYRWRGGEHRLLDGVAREYAGALTLRTLDKSFRSSPPVVELINLAGRAVSSLADALPGKVIAEWTDGWRDHESARAEVPGYACVRCVEPETPWAEPILEALAEIDPIRRGLTCAILLRTNEDVRDVAHALRAAGFMEVMSDCDESVMVDNPVTAALTEFLAAVAHPGDTASAGFAAMTPLGDVVTARGGWEPTRRWALTRIAEAGFEALTSEVWSALGGRLPDGAFADRRYAQWLQVTRAFDATGSRDVDEFLEFAKSQTQRDEAGAGRVQVMTIHRSKGLGFDVVFLPVPAGKRMDALPNSVFLAPRDDRHRPRWVLKRPMELLASADPELGSAFDELRAEAAYENLCVGYVALTRARHALYVLAQPLKNAEQPTTARWIWSAVPELVETDRWETGDPRWFENVRRPVPTLPARPAVVDWERLVVRPRLDRARPSDRLGDADAGAAGQWLAEPHGRTFGAAVHAAFAAIDWLDGAAAADVAEVLRGSGFDEDIVAEVSGCWATAEIAELFRKPDGLLALWRERAFDVLVDGRWVSGVFDRVIVRDGWALIVEFKTDRAPAALAETYAGQLSAYRAAVAILTGLAIDRVGAVIVHTPTRAVVAGEIVTIG